MWKRKPVLIWLGSSVAAVALYVWFFGAATLFAIEARQLERRFPIVKRTPIALSDLSISNTPGKTVSYAGYEFEVPWTFDRNGTKQISPTSVIIAFDSGNALWFSRVPPKEFVKTLQKCSCIDLSNLRQLFGDALDSDYSVHKLILNTTPQEIGPLSSRKDVAGGMMLLLLKATMMPNGAETGIFQVRTNNFQGFQYGDPRRRPRFIDVEIFAADGGLAFLFVHREVGSAPAITQAESNRVVQSAHRIQKSNL